MKISSVSKKVLASALSAAMVVAFAPTVAFGTIAEGQSVTIKWDTTGLKLANGATAAVDKTVLIDDQIHAHIDAPANYTFANGDTITGWYYDANNDGIYDTDNESGDVALSALTGGYLAFDADADIDAAITLKPIAEVGFTATNTKNSSIVQPKATDGNITTVAITAGNSVYAVSLAKDGAELATATINGTGNATFKLAETIDASHKKTEGYVAAADYGKGAYTVTVKDLATGKSVVKAFSIIEVTIKGIFGTTVKEVNKKVYAYKGDAVKDSSVISGEIASPTGKSDTTNNAETAKGYALNGVQVASNSTTKLADGDVLTPIYNDTVLAQADYKIDDKAIVINGVGLAGCKAIIAGNGIEKEVPLTGNPNQVLYGWGSATAPTGTYNVTVYSNVDGVAAAKLAEASVTLVAVTLDAGEMGKIAASDKVVVAAAGTKYADMTLATPNTAANPTVTFAGWSTDGVSVLKSDAKVSADTTLKAVYNTTGAEKAAYSWADGILTLTAPAGYDAYVSIDNATAAKYTAPIALAANATGLTTVDVTLTATTGNLATDPATYQLTSTNGRDITSALANALVTTTSDSTSTAPKYYSVVLKSATDAATKAFKDKAYATDTEWAALTLEQDTAVLQAVADYEAGVLDALVAGSTAADGSVKKIDASAAEAAKAAIKVVVADYVAANDTDPKTLASKVRTDYVKDIHDAAADAVKTAVTYAKADVDAAAAVTAQLKDPATAAAGLEAYKALTDAQKELVSIADLAAAEEAVASQALIDAQDEGTLNKISTTKKLTFTAKKAKTTKARYITYTTKVSKSGNAVVYAKKSGSSKITVAASGKVTLKKGAVKGKTYTAKVTATCGTQSRTVNVKFIVK